MNKWRTIVIRNLKPIDQEYLEILIANELAMKGIETEEFGFNIEVDYLENKEI
jgi:hypothetical protein